MEAWPTILLIYDEKSTRPGFMFGLFSPDSGIVKKKSGACQASSLAAEIAYGLVDFNPPDGNGLDLGKCIRLNDSEPPLVINTDAGYTQVVINAMFKGDDNFLVQPVDMHGQKNSPKSLAV